MFRLHYHVGSELRANRSPYDLAKMAKYLSTFTAGRIRHSRPILDDPYAVFAARWLADRHFCRVVYLVRHPAGIVSSLKRIGTRWSDNLPDIAAQPELIKAYLSDFSDDIDRTLSRAVRRGRARLPALPADPLRDRPGRRAPSGCDRRPIRGSGRAAGARVPAVVRSPGHGVRRTGRDGDQDRHQPAGLAAEQPLGPRRTVQDRLPADGQPRERMGVAQAPHPVPSRRL